MNFQIFVKDSQLFYSTTVFTSCKAFSSICRICILCNIKRAKISLGSGDLENFLFSSLHKMMNTFKKFLEYKLNEEVPPPAPPPAGGGISGPGALPPMGGGMPPPPMGGGMPMPPMGGGMPPPMGGMPGAPAGGGAPQKLKAYNVWDVLERVLSGDGQEKAEPQK